MPQLMTRQAARTIGLLAPFVRSKLAADQRVDLRKLLMGVSCATWEDDKPRILKGVQRLTKGKLAQDASIGEVAELLDLIDSHGVEQDESATKAQHEAMAASAAQPPKQQGAEFMPKKGSYDQDVHPSAHTHVHDFLRGKISDDDLHHVHKLMAGSGLDTDPDADLAHKRDEEVERESESFKGEEESSEGWDEDLGEGKEGGERIKSLTGGEGTGEDEPYDAPGGGSESSQEHRDNMNEWRRGNISNRPGTDKKRADDKRRADDRMRADDKRRADDKKRADDRRRAHDQPPPFKGRPNPGGSMDKRAHDSAEGMVTKAAMDAAIKAASEAASKVQKDIRDAERAVRPYVGDMQMSFDSADNVYAQALKMLNVQTKDVHPSAFPTLLKYASAPAKSQAQPLKIAADAAAVKSYAERFPEATRIRSI